MCDKTKREVEAVKQLGSQIGYGHLMEIASALWRKELNDEYGIKSGGFVPVCTYSIKKKEMPLIEKSCKQYDKLIRE